MTDDHKICSGTIISRHTSFLLISMQRDIIYQKIPQCRGYCHNVKC